MRVTVSSTNKSGNNANDWIFEGVGITKSDYVPPAPQTPTPAISNHSASIHDNYEEKEQDEEGGTL